MTKKLEFNLLETVDHEQFSNEVQSLLNEGWEFHGHLIAFPNYNGKDGVHSVRYIQAFVRKIKDKWGTS